MPIMLRPNNKSRRIAENVMNLAQKYGEDVETMEVEEAELKESPLQRPKNERKFQPIGDFGSFIGTQSG